MVTFGAGSRNVKSGWSGDEFHGFQSTEDRRLIELYGIVGLPVFAKFTENIHHGDVSTANDINKNTLKEKKKTYQEHRSQ